MLKQPGGASHLVFVCHSCLPKELLSELRADEQRISQVNDIFNGVQSSLTGPGEQVPKKRHSLFIWPLGQVKSNALNEMT